MSKRTTKSKGKKTHWAYNLGDPFAKSAAALFVLLSWELFSTFSLTFTRLYRCFRGSTTTVRRHRPQLLLLIVIPPLLPTLPSSVKKLLKLVPRRRLRVVVIFVAASMVTAASVCRHHPILLLLMIILPLLPTLLSSVKALPKLVPRSRWCVAAGSNAAYVDAAAATASDNNPTPTTLLSSVKKLLKLKPRRLWRLSASSTTTPVDAAAAVRCHHLPLLLLTMILPLPSSLLSSIEKCPSWYHGAVGVLLLALPILPWMLL